MSERVISGWQSKSGKWATVGRAIGEWVRWLVVAPFRRSGDGMLCAGRVGRSGNRVGNCVVGCSAADFDKQSVQQSSSRSAAFLCCDYHKCSSHGLSACVYLIARLTLQPICRKPFVLPSLLFSNHSPVISRGIHRCRTSGHFIKQLCVFWFDKSWVLC